MIKPDDGHYRPKHVVFLPKNITSNQTYTVVLLTIHPLISSYTHNGDDTLQSWVCYLLSCFQHGFEYYPLARLTKVNTQKCEDELQHRQQMILKIMTGVRMNQYFKNGWELH